MKRLGLRARLLATGLSALAGFVDAVGYLTLGGFFVSFMSGNTTRLAAGVALHGRDILIAGGLIGTFLAGVVVSTLVGARLAHRREWSLLILLFLALSFAALLATLGQPWLACFVAAFAMGGENALFEREGEVAVGLTYMTGTLVKCGQSVATALTGGNRWAWLPYLTLWSGLAGGAVLGALAFGVIGSRALWLAAGVAGVIALSARPRAGTARHR